MAVHVTRNTELIIQYEVDFDESMRQGTTVYRHDASEAKIPIPGVRNCDVRHFEKDCSDLQRSRAEEISYNTRNTQALRKRTGGDVTGRHSECWERFYRESKVERTRPVK